MGPVAQWMTRLSSDQKIMIVLKVNAFAFLTAVSGLKLIHLTTIPM